MSLARCKTAALIIHIKAFYEGIQKKRKVKEQANQQRKEKNSLHNSSSQSC